MSFWKPINPGWKATSCDHFGVSTYGAPAKTTYSWLVDNGSRFDYDPEKYSL